MTRFFSAEPLAVGSTITLDREQSAHLSRVLRLRKGAQVELVNGSGMVAIAEVLLVDSRGCDLAVLDVSRTESLSRVGIAFGIPKGGALDFVIRRSTELGIGSLQPLITEHSLTKKQWNPDRWKRVCREVAKQCQLAHFPNVHDPMPLAQWMASRSKNRSLILCSERHRRAEPPPADGASGIDICIGAEGGWTEGEEALFDQSGARRMGLGPLRLRTELAAVTAIILIKREIGEI